MIIRRIEGSPRIVTVPVTISKTVDLNETRYVPQTKYVDMEVIRIHPIKTVYVTRHVVITKRVELPIAEPVVVTRKVYKDVVGGAGKEQIVPKLAPQPRHYPLNVGRVARIEPRRRLLRNVIV